MADEFENDPALQSGGVGTGVVITPTNGPQATPAPASSSAPANAHAPIASSSPSASPSPTPTPTSSKPVSGATFASTAPDATPTPSDKKDSEDFLQEIPVLGDAMRMLTGGGA